MRFNLSFNRGGWPHTLDHRQIIIVAFLLRLVIASFYDVAVSINKYDWLVPDGRYYSGIGQYSSLVMKGYNEVKLKSYMHSMDEMSLSTFEDTIDQLKGRFFPTITESVIFGYIVGALYFMFGPFTIIVRIFNIILSIASAYLIFKIAKRKFGDLTANVFLPIALFLPTQFGYSITLSRDFLRVFAVSFIFYLIYGGVICLKKPKT